MDKDEEPIEIVLSEADQKENPPEIKVEEDEKPSVPEISPEDGIEALKRQYEEERQARLNAESRATNAMRQAQEAQIKISENDLLTVKTAISTLTRESEIMEANLANALASGDYQMAAKLNVSLADARTQLKQLENGRVAMEEQAKQPRAPIEQMDPIVDPVEALASQLSPRSAAWVRAHPEYAKSRRLTQQMIAAHNFVTADGIVPDTDDYFAAVERVLGMGNAPAVSVAAAEAPMSAAAAPAQRRSSPAAAPVSRSGSGAGGSSSNVVRLTLQEREMASNMGMTLEEYARNKNSLIKEGKITRH